MRVIEIDSGIAGLSVAAASRKVCIEVSLYERATELREVGAGINLGADTLRALDALGAAVRAASLPWFGPRSEFGKGDTSEWHSRPSTSK
jgi:2-polyprenyl-6-methoxyphenol hydroxylase-like FAD-dependent oxidoreductase